MYFDNDDKLKAFLKKESARLGISINNTYNTYFSKILLERISAMSYDELLVKGSFSELAHLNEMTRPITDIDLVSTKYHNDPLLILFRAMCDIMNLLHYLNKLKLVYIKYILKQTMEKLDILFP